MLRLLSQLTRQPVISQTSPEPIGFIRQAIIDPDKGMVVAYELAGRQAERFVATIDVTAYLDQGVVIRDDGAVEPAPNLPRLGALLDNPIKPFGLPVVTDKDRRLGKASDYQFETTTHAITKLHVQPGLWTRLLESELIIPRDQIVKMTDQRIVVRYDATRPAAEVIPAEPIS